ncbi:MAG: HAD family phosphatase [Defluviitaleaceae bacterium]|nr:HAD family phosphatase [Defluviitaleaceae bacterium]
MIKNIIFDLGRVIYSYWPQQDLINLGYNETKINKFMSRVYDSPLWAEFDRGTYTIAEGVEKLCADYPDMADDFRRVFNETWADRIIKIMPDSLEFFYEVKRRGFGVYILTNFPEDSFAYCRARDDFFNEADGIVVSAHEKLIKPDAAIYECLLNRYNLVPEETIFIDDMLHNIEGAEALGIHGIQFTDLDSCKKQFEEIINASR